MAMAVGLGEAFGGTTPLICHGFVTTMGSPIAPAFYLMLCSFLGWIAIKGSSSLLENREKQGLKTQPFPLSKKSKKMVRATG
jgi:hypothetical protein